MKEKRKYQRFAIKLPALCKIANSDSFQTTIVNMGAEGFGIVLDRHFDLGTEADLQVELDNKEKVTVKVRVVRMDAADEGGKYYAGVKIIDSTRTAEEKFIRYYIKKVLVIS